MIELNLQRRRGAFEMQVNATLNAAVSGLFGPSGAGKSSLLGMIAGFIRPDSGSLVIDGICLFHHEKNRPEKNIDVPIHQRRIGMVFQESRLFPHLSVEDNLAYGYKLLPAKDRRFEFNQIVELLELGRLLAQKPHQLSGGEKQRVALGRALLTSPRLLLLDEPLASLDVRLKHQILPFLRRVKNEINIPMVYVSHAIDEILYLTNHVAIIDHGELLGAGQFHEVMQDPRVLTLAHSLGLENVMHVEVASHSVQDGYTIATLGANLGTNSGGGLGSQQLHMPLVEVVVGKTVSVSVAASNIALSTHPLSGVTIQNQLYGVVKDISHVGMRVLVSIDVGSVLIAEITAKALQDLRIVPGKGIYCLIKTQSLRPLALSN